MTKRASLSRQISDELNARTRYGVSRHRLKEKRRDEVQAATGTRPWSVSTGFIHSENTKNAYWRVLKSYAGWARDEHGIRDASELHERASELPAAYLAHLMERGTLDRYGRETGRDYSAWSLAQYRAGLRFLYPDSCEGVELPRRRRLDIQNNRGDGYSRGNHVDLGEHPELVGFLAATGLRRREVEALTVGRVSVERDDAGGVAGIVVHVTNGKGGRIRDVRAVGDADELAAVAALVEDRDARERVFPDGAPDALRVHALRRAFAQRAYLDVADRDELPDPAGRLDAGSYDEAAVLSVSQQLGHNRRDIVLIHYLR